MMVEDSKHKVPSPLPKTPPTGISGLTAALLSHRRDDGSLDFGALELTFHGVVQAGVRCISAGGATGEYPAQDLAERLAVIREAGHLARRAGVAFLPAVGASYLSQSVQLAKAAASAGAQAVLLPPPHFFRYSQEDLVMFYRAAAARIPLPVLLYNLPCFVTPVETATALALLREGVIGIKDSGGSLETLKAITAAHGSDVLRLVGNDALLEGALQLGACDGCVSGVAGVLPELVLAVLDPARRAAALPVFRKMLGICDALPAPWALKVIAGMRGWGNPGFPFPATPSRQDQAKQVERFVRQELVGYCSLPAARSD